MSLSQRLAIQRQLQAILAANQLVRDILPEPAVDVDNVALAIESEEVASVVFSTQPSRRGSLDGSASAFAPKQSVF